MSLVAFGKPHLYAVTDAVVPREPTRWQGNDDVLFHRRQIKRGVRLVYSGRTDHGTIYVVDEIRSHRVNRRGALVEYQLEPTASPLHLSDWVVLKKLGANEFRTVRFGYLSYSAAWRIEPP